MNHNYDITDDDLRLVLRQMDDRDTWPLPSDLSDRVMSRYARAKHEQSLLSHRHVAVWAAAACLALAIGLTVALWPKPEANIYEDTFASVEEASLVLCNNMDDNTIAL